MPITASFSSPAKPLLAPSMKISPSKALPETFFSSATPPGKFFASIPAPSASQTPTASPPAFLSGWARPPDAPPSCPARFQIFAATSRKRFAKFWRKKNLRTESWLRPRVITDRAPKKNPHNLKTTKAQDAMGKVCNVKISLARSAYGKAIHPAPGAGLHSERRIAMMNASFGKVCSFLHVDDSADELYFV